MSKFPPFEGLPASRLSSPVSLETKQPSLYLASVRCNFIIQCLIKFSLAAHWVTLPIIQVPLWYINLPLFTGLETSFIFQEDASDGTVQNVTQLPGVHPLFLSKIAGRSALSFRSILKPPKNFFLQVDRECTTLVHISATSLQISFLKQ